MSEGMRVRDFRMSVKRLKGNLEGWDYPCIPSQVERRSMLCEVGVCVCRSTLKVD